MKKSMYLSVFQSNWILFRFLQQHWYFDWQFELSKLQPGRASLCPRCKFCILHGLHKTQSYYFAWGNGTIIAFWSSGVKQKQLGKLTLRYKILWTNELGNLLEQFATCSAQTVSQDTNVAVEVSEVVIKITSGLTV